MDIWGPVMDRLREQAGILRSAGTSTLPPDWPTAMPVPPRMNRKARRTAAAIRRRA